MQVRDTSLNPLPLCLHCQEKQGDLIDRPCPKEQGALGERPGPAQGWALIMPCAQRQEGPTSLSGRVMGRPSRWTEGLGPSGSQLCWENLPQERLVLRGTKMLKKTSLLKMRVGWGVGGGEEAPCDPFTSPPQTPPILGLWEPSSYTLWSLRLHSCLDSGFPSLGLFPNTPRAHSPLYPLTFTHLGDSLSLQSGEEKMLTKSDSRCHDNHSPNYCVQPGFGLWEGGWERDEGGGVVRLVPTATCPPRSCSPSLPVLASRGPMPHLISPLPRPPLALALHPQVQCPVSLAS